ncbi:unnamed protein product, partial [Didymodactylos carnosus]
MEFDTCESSLVSRNIAWHSTGSIILVIIAPENLINCDDRRSPSSTIRAPVMPRSPSRLVPHILPTPSTSMIPRASPTPSASLAVLSAIPVSVERLLMKLSTARRPTANQMPRRTLHIWRLKTSGIALFLMAIVSVIAALIIYFPKKHK